MKVRDSGMPDEVVWDAFFEPDRILTALGCTDPAADVVDFGCGYGTFTVAAAGRTRGRVYALDIDRSMIDATSARAAAANLPNVHTIERDFVALGTGLPRACADYTMLFNILHAENPLVLLEEARRLLRPGGKLAVLHWNYDAATPRGPNMQIRPQPEQCRNWVCQVGFELVLPHVDLPPHHYGIVARI
jgi:SAM-dependent methyltransferase